MMITFDEARPTVNKLPMFREACAKRRCLIPAAAFYEWEKRQDGKQPYRFRRKDLEPFAFAGIRGVRTSRRRHSSWVKPSPSPIISATSPTGRLS